MSQNDEVLSLLKMGPTSAYTAYFAIGTMRLAARIHDLRAKGYKITTIMVRLWSGSRVATYTLED